MASPTPMNLQRYAGLMDHRQGHAAFGGAVHLGEDKARDAHGLVK